MDLRRRLVGYLGALLGGLMLMAILINLHSLRADLNAEVDASTQLVKVLLAAGQPATSPAQLQALLGEAPLRHLSIQPGPGAAADEGSRSWLSALLGLAPRREPAQTIRLGEQTLHIAPNPASEIEERLDDTVRLCITLLFYSGATLLVAWWAAHRALSPVRELEAGLQRLARGEAEAALPPFALREFSQVAGAIDDLAAALNEGRAAQRQLARQLIEVQEAERKTLARELHDEMGQTLTAIGVTAAYLERHAGQLDAGRVAECAQELRRDVKTSGQQLRGMLRQLRPHGLDAGGLASALRELVGNWQQREWGIDFQLAMPPALPSLGEAAGLALYRVVQEGLTNVVRHSGARHCRVSIGLAVDELRLAIEDDGQGLPASAAAHRGGLLGMVERLDMVGGRLEVAGGPGQGLQLRVSLPLTSEEQQEEQP